MHQVHWVFGYGSLMWDPGFQPAETVKARLNGYARSFCLRSTHYRGTETSPGLVLGLDRNGDADCSGLAMRIAHDKHDEVMAYLHAREMSTEAYIETIVTLALEDGREVEALTYTMRKDHDHYACNLSIAEQARIIATAQGRRGPNADYLFNTARHLTEIGLADSSMDQLSAEVRRLLNALKQPEAG